MSHDLEAVAEAVSTMVRCPSGHEPTINNLAGGGAQEWCPSCVERGCPWLFDRDFPSPLEAAHAWNAARAIEVFCLDDILQKAIHQAVSSISPPRDLIEALRKAARGRLEPTSSQEAQGAAAVPSSKGATP